jgi:hypothetical protein
MANSIKERDVELASRLALSGCKLSTIALAIGITGKEAKELSENNPELKRALEIGRSRGIGLVADNLFRIATETNDVNAIKYYLGLQSTEYIVDKALVEINNDNRAISLPTIEEARRIINSDPAMLPSTDTDEPNK